MTVKNKSKRQIKSIDVYATISFIGGVAGSGELMEFHPIKIHRIDDIPPGGTADFEFLGTFSAQIIDNARGRSASGGGYFFPEIGIEKSFHKTWSPNMKIQYRAVSDGVDVGQVEIYLPESSNFFATKKPDDWKEAAGAPQLMGHGMLFRDTESSLASIIEHIGSDPAPAS